VSDDKEKEKITVLNFVPDERLGGPQRRVLEAAKRLKQKGIDTVVVVPKGDPTYAALLNEAGIDCRQTRAFRRLPRPTSPVSVAIWLMFFFPAVVLLSRVIRRYRAEVVHVNGILNLQVALAAKIAGAKLVLHVNDVRDLGLLKPPLRFLLLRLSDWVVMASAAAWNNWLGDGCGEPANVSVLYPPVDTQVFHPDQNGVEAKRELGIGPDDKVVGIVGNMNPVKGYEVFLTAAEMTRDMVPGVRFLIVGQTLDTQVGYWHSVQSLLQSLGLEKDVVLAGKRTDVAWMMSAMDVFVLTSRFEAAPIVLLEAAACGKPIVATRVGGVPELVSEGETAILVPPDDPGSVAEAVVRLLNNAEEARRIGASGRQWVVSRFDVAICAEKHEEVYRRLVGSDREANPNE
jgi:glycosyltransferase involved in cell wall biosynthesis